MKKRRLLSIVLSLCMVLTFVPVTVNAMDVYVNLSVIGKDTLTLDVESGDSIENVKAKIKGKTGYPEAFQILKYNGKVLEYGKTLADYKIQKKCTIELSFGSSVSAYATKAQLMGDAFAPNADGTANRIGKLVFGKNRNGNPQEWYILGKDTYVTGDNTIIFAASPIATNQKFEDDRQNNKGYNASFGVYTSNPADVYPNHYGASDLRTALQEMENSNFTTAEQGLMNDTTVKTKDTKNSSVTYTTTDKLYALAADGFGELYTTIKAGSNNQIVLAASSYWNSGDGFWLRSPHDKSGDSMKDTAHLGMPENGNIANPSVQTERDVRPASNLNLSSVLFASSAKAASSDTAESEEIAAGTAMTLRLDGSSKNIGAVAYRTATGDIIATKGSTTDDVALVVQGSDGEKDWYYSKKIGTSETINASDIKSALCLTSDIDLSACKIWLETTDTDGLIYAVEAAEILRITSVAITGIETPVSNTALDTEAVCTTTGVNSTTPSVTWTPSDSTAGYNTSYTASITLTADAGYEFMSSATATVNGEAASVKKNDDGTLTVTYEFPATKAAPGTSDGSNNGSKPAADKSSDTGDSTSLAPWIALMLLAGAGITGAGFYTRRKRTNE